MNKVHFKTSKHCENIFFIACFSIMHVKRESQISWTTDPAKVTCLDCLSEIERQKKSNADGTSALPGNTNADETSALPGECEKQPSPCSSVRSVANNLEPLRSYGPYGFGIRVEYFYERPGKELSLAEAKRFAGAAKDAGRHLTARYLEQLQEFCPHHVELNFERPVDAPEYCSICGKRLSHELHE